MHVREADHQLSDTDTDTDTDADADADTDTGSERGIDAGATGGAPARRARAPRHAPGSVAGSVAGSGAAGGRRTPGKASRTTQKWSRLLHVYTSMVCFVVVLFFSVTGITLNHPTWVLGKGESRETVEGTMPANWKSGDTIDWLNVSEYLRDEHGLTGHVDSHQADAAQASITFKGPGVQADTFIDLETGAYELTVDRQGLLAVMNDLHKGRDTTSSWRWLIDVVAGVLVVISASGLLLQLFLRKRRRSAMVTAAAGGVVTLFMVWLTLR